jgi:hypothetical protein
MRLAPALLLTWAGWASAAGSDAQNSGDLRLDWQATPSCSSSAQLRADIARDLRGSPSGARRVSARARANQTTDGSWHVELVTEADGESHQRSFEAESCAAAESALALILAFAINPQAAPAAPDEPAPSPTAVETEAAPVTRAPAPQASAAIVSAREQRAPIASPPPPPRARSSAARLAGVSAALAFDLGTLPALAEGAQLALGFYPGRWRFELAGTDWSNRTGMAQTGAATARFRLYTGAARAGYTWPVGRLAVGAVLAADLAQLKAAGSNTRLTSIEQNDLLGGVSAGGLLAWSLGERVELHFLVAGVHWFERPKFVVDEPKPANPVLVYQAPAVVGRAELGAGVRFF